MAKVLILRKVSLSPCFSTRYNIIIIKKEIESRRISRNYSSKIKLSAFSLLS